VAVVRRRIERNEDPTAEELLALIAETRKLIPPEFRRVMGKVPEPPTPLDAPTLDATTLDDFEFNTVRETLASVIAELRLVVEAEQKQLFEKALDSYYAMEQAARDPKNAHLIPHLEEVRNAFEKSGTPMPTKEETEARRRWEEMEVAGDS
jgi:hypothetical protein